jgi:hypothetical protein
VIPEYRVHIHCSLCKQEILTGGLCGISCRNDGKMTERKVIVVQYKKEKEREEERSV